LIQQGESNPSLFQFDPLISWSAEANFCWLANSCFCAQIGANCMQAFSLHTTLD